MHVKKAECYGRVESVLGLAGHLFVSGLLRLNLIQSPLLNYTLLISHNA